MRIAKSFGAGGENRGVYRREPLKDGIGAGFISVALTTDSKRAIMPKIESPE